MATFKGLGSYKDMHEDHNMLFADCSKTRTINKPTMCTWSYIHLTSHMSLGSSKTYPDFFNIKGSTFFHNLSVHSFWTLDFGGGRGVGVCIQSSKLPFGNGPYWLAHCKKRRFQNFIHSQDRIAFPFEPPMKAKKQGGLGAGVFFFGNFLTVMINFPQNWGKEKTKEKTLLGQAICVVQNCGTIWE